MYKLINMNNYEGYIKENFKGDYNNLGQFLNKHEFDGIELIQYGFWNEKSIPKELIKGVHLRFYPIWIDFWKQDKSKIKQKLQNEDNLIMLYGGKDRQCIIDYYKKELEIADKIGVEYVVMHVCHVDILECYSYEFEYNDLEVIEASIELINEVFDNEKYKFKLLLENLWWPGLKLKSKSNMEKLLKDIKYNNIGFMLDTGHLINTNLNLKNSDEAIDYIVNTINDLGNLKEYINGVHLNYSLTGEYVLESKKQFKDNKIEYNFKDIFINSYNHISKIDRHKPFENYRVKEILDLLPIEYLVYELLEESFDKLEKSIQIQDKYLKNKNRE